MDIKTARKILIIIFAAALFAFAAVFACGISENVIYAEAETDTGFTYHSIDVKAEVGEDKVLKISEKLTLQFSEEGRTSFRRGVMKTFASRPNKNGIFPVRRFDADLREACAKVGGEPVNVDSAVSGNGAYYLVYIGGEEAFHADTPLEVEFDYVYDMSADVTQGYGELLFPAFNDAYFWVKKGARYNLEAVFPEGFCVDGVKTTLMDGEGEWSPAEGDYIKAEGNVFKASFTMRERVMFALELPDGLFTVPYFSEYWVFFGIAVALIAACAAVTYINRGRTPVYSVEFTPPDVNPLFFSAYWHGYTRKRDAATLILQWANLGCVRLKRGGKRDIIIEKLAPLPKDRLKEEIEYFNALFWEGNVYSSKEVKRRGHFRHRCRINNAVYDLMNRADEAVTYVRSAEKARGAVPVLGFLTVAVAATYFAHISCESGYVVLVGMLALVGSFEVYGLYLFKSISRAVRSVLVLRIIVTLFLISFIGPLIAVAGFAVYLY
ncbi:MAG: DUF2207 domain-containing protein [Clostridia bacterium]|nr:DUF2207 domain-containing protein [Clostridia bacterium]